MKDYSDKTIRQLRAIRNNYSPLVAGNKSPEARLRHRSAYAELVKRNKA